MKCNNCNGSGEVKDAENNMVDCPNCYGSGERRSFWDFGRNKQHKGGYPGFELPWNKPKHPPLDSLKIEHQNVAVGDAVFVSPEQAQSLRKVIPIFQTNPARPEVKFDVDALCIMLHECGAQFEGVFGHGGTITLDCQTLEGFAESLNELLFKE